MNQITVEEILLGGYLWPHQVSAIENSRAYITSGSSSGALNRLPTGTGKSGIITVLSRCYPDCKNVLVLVPSITLKEQLKADIEFDFFEKIKLANQPFKKAVDEFVPTTLESKLNALSEPTIFITTIQSLNAIRKDAKDLFSRLSKEMDLVIFDEGHREPAPQWADTVRAINKPRILFTATPYRNDRLSFDIDGKYTYSFHHADAVAGNYIRDIEFKSLPAGAIRPDKFVQSLIDFYNSELPQIKPANVDQPRVIIRCVSFEQILEISGYIAAAGISVIGIHERFEADIINENQKPNRVLQKYVPNVKKDRKKIETSAGSEAVAKYNKQLPIFWVHQYKLLEGVDEFSFCVVADYAPMTNARMLIQQVGRIIRNRDLLSGTKGFVFFQQGAPDEKFWEGYLKYEKNYDDSTAMNTLYYQEMYDQVSGVMPIYHYENKDFKTLFDALFTPDPDAEDEDDIIQGRSGQSYFNHFKYRLSCQILRNENQYNLDEIEQSIKIELAQEEYILRTESAERPNDDTIVFAFVRAIDSPVLLDQYFLTFHPGYCIIRITPNYVFYYNSAGGSSSFLNEEYALLNPDELKRVFPGGSTSLRSITLRSTDIGPHIVRRQQISAAALENTVADLMDYLNFYSTATGKSGISSLHQAQSYVGFTRSRITEQTGKPITYYAYREWLDEIDKHLSSASTGSSFFDRYAQYTSAPVKSDPVNILIDFDEIVGRFTHIITGHLLECNLTCCEIKQGEFSLILKIPDQKNVNTLIENEYKINVFYDKAKKRYLLSCDQLKADYEYSDPDGVIKPRVNVISYLNREQCFRIVPEDPSVIYAHRQFYEPKLAIFDKSKPGKIELLNVFQSDPAFRTKTSEKGKNCTPTGWEQHSLFGLVDELGKNTILGKELASLDYLICDDAGNNETADFIGLELSPPRIVMMHCKVPHSERKRSASSLQEVASQAVKNLYYLVPSNMTPPSNSANWQVPNSWSAADVKGILNRLRHAPPGVSHPLPTGKLLEIFFELNRNPSTSKEVFLLLGQGFDLNAFKKNVAQKKPDPANIQIAYLVQSTWSNVRKVASKFLIFCN